LLKFDNTLTESTIVSYDSVVHGWTIGLNKRFIWLFWPLKLQADIKSSHVKLEKLSFSMIEYKAVFAAVRQECTSPLSFDF